MGKIGKVLGIIVLLIVIVIAGLVAFVNYYLTEERVKALVIPQAEEALGRNVAIGEIRIGLFSGITIQDFLIKEEDGENNFVSARAFVLSYELLPLLQKKLIISEILLDEPAIQIVRQKNGRFNFASLNLLAEEPQTEKAEESKPSAAALPLALTINQVRLTNARIKIRDTLNEIPAVDATAGASLNVAVGRTMQDLQYNGTFNFEADIAYAEAKSSLQGKGTISQKDMDIAVDAVLEDEEVHAEADVKNYLQSPNATIAISSKSLNIDKLMSLAAGMPQAQKDTSAKTGPAKGKADDIIADSLPENLVAQGTVKVDKALYKGLVANDFSLDFELAKGVLTVQELSAGAYGGKVNSNMVVDLNKPGPAYDGKLELQSVQAGDFSSALKQKLAGMFSGTLQSALTFSGSGTTWEQISRDLTADGSFSLTDGGIKGTPVSMSIANLLGLQELKNISYKNISGTFKVVEGGKVAINTNLQGPEVDAEAQGLIGLDGTLNLPLTFHLSPALADKLKARASFAKYLTDEQGGATLNLKLAGSLQNPQPTLNMQGVQDQLKKSLEKKLLEHLEGSSSDSEQKTSPENMIKGLFGR